MKTTMLLVMMLSIGVIIGGTAKMQTTQEFTKVEEVSTSSTVSTVIEQNARANQQYQAAKEIQEIKIFIKVTPSKGYKTSYKSKMKIPEPTDSIERQFMATLKAQYEQSREEAILANGDLAVNSTDSIKDVPINDTFGTNVDVSTSTTTVTSSTSYVTG